MPQDPPCINLSERFGDRYRIFWDESYDPKHVPREKRDPWYMELRGGKRGPRRNDGPGFTIYPYGHDTLALECDYHNRTAAQLAKIPGVKLSQDGTWEKTFLFDVSLFGTIAEIVRPRQKRTARTLTEEEKGRLAETGRQALARLYQQATSKSPSTVQDAGVCP